VTASFPAARERPVLEPNPSGKRLALLSLTALGVVYGDIGTSPLYAMKQCFRVDAGGPAGAAVPPTPDNVFGVLSLIVWALTMVVTVNFDGKVLDTEIVESSGSTALDRRAKAIARNAGPFGRFSDAMRRKADQIVVVSRFKFTRDETLETNLTSR